MRTPQCRGSLVRLLANLNLIASFPLKRVPSQKTNSLLPDKLSDTTKRSAENQLESRIGCGSESFLQKCVVLNTILPSEELSRNLIHRVQEQLENNFL